LVFPEKITVSGRLLVDNQSALDDTCGDIVGASVIAFDTEFVRESTYFAKLCLIQLATDKLTVCIDLVAELDSSALWAMLLAERVALLAHSARQDLELVWQTTRARPAQVLDTQIAAALLGHPPQIGLRELLIAESGVTIEKTLSRTDWTRRPLRAAEIEYAASDVRYLLALWRTLDAKLERAGRKNWFLEDCSRALNVVLEPDLVAVYQRTKGTGRLQGEQIEAALALLDWREQRAQSADRPRRWILADETLVAMATALPTSIQALRHIEGLPQRTIDKQGEAMLAVLERAAEGAYAAQRRACTAAEKPDAAALKALQAHVRNRAASLKIEPEVIAAKRDLTAAVLGNPPEHLVRGWRAEVIDHPLLRG
jgi:ribonuclease D